MLRRKVLLIGCETAVSDRGAPADEMELAQAFVLRGSEEVPETISKVADSTAAALVDKLRYPAPALDAFRVYVP